VRATVPAGNKSQRLPCSLHSNVQANPSFLLPVLLSKEFVIHSLERRKKKMFD
jgi:hypothetical protein